MDTHQYIAWGPALPFMSNYCTQYRATMQMAKTIKYEVWVGEWSLATDVCATWLGGFNDANTDASRTCQWVDCPPTYMGEHGTDFDRTVAALGPFGQTGKGDKRDHSLIRNGQCAIDSAHWDDSHVMTLGQCMIDIFNENVDAHFIWTVRNELEPRWNYIDSYDNGWIKNQAPTEFSQ